MHQVSSLWLKETVARALAEDIGPGDVTTALSVNPAKKGRAVVIAREDIILAGTQAFEEVFLQIGGVEIEFTYYDGNCVKAGETIVSLRGILSSILTGERTALNFLMRMSGIATLTSKFVSAVSGTKCAITDTRKTTPGLRAIEKAAVLTGGGRNHRFGLYDGILIKDNHIAAAGSIAEAVKLAKTSAPHTLKIEVEVENIQELEKAIEAGADIVMLDNMTVEETRRAVEITNGRVLLESSGNMTVERAKEFAGTGVDLISVGALTHSAPSANLSMKIRKTG